MACHFPELMLSIGCEPGEQIFTGEIPASLAQFECVTIFWGSDTGMYVGTIG